MNFLNQTLSETFSFVAESCSTYFITICYAIFFVALFVYLYTGLLICERHCNGAAERENAKDNSFRMTTTLPTTLFDSTLAAPMYENQNWLIETHQHYSPLNISRNEISNARKVEALHWENHNTLPSIMLLHNTGQHAVLQGVYPLNNPIVFGANLPASYSFVQVAFRWEADHMLDDRRFPLEMQVLYHFEGEEEEEEGDDITSHDKLVVAFLFDIGHDGEYNASLKPIVDSLQHITLPSSKVRIPTIPLGTIMPLYVGGFYCYVGSMIDHPFYEGTKWAVFSKPLIIGRDQLQQFHQLLACDGNPIKYSGRPAKTPRF